ncbi:hypothetical protein DAPPUDRAFT_317231 [Daphnia pulex]|uniref:Chorion peroxidase n=1 Tax=Daphnia pulex TaxID=6669 RepID=E9GFB0_DAPPU|nr:hypothetical protein DAPPUDRAFT_317231 [Daphnia pulex]|eukprot:EFX81607.1 hypothetical protein DAPPUDRAFT_317231 [Daphnia pulex]
MESNEIHEALPLIDVFKTSIGRFCSKPQKCEVKRFRSYDGTCNNLDNPNWGAISAPFRRLIPPDYADDISLPRISVTGEQLPTARYISSTIHRDLGFHDHAVTVFLPAFGQLIDHDMASGAETKDPRTNAEPKCCDVSPDRRHPACWPIDIPANDPFYSLFGRRCLEFVRSATGLKDKCKLGSRSTFNTVTSFLDASFVYGTAKETSHKLRTFRGGWLNSNTALRNLGLKELLPSRTENPDDNCKRPSRDLFCFEAGDGRVNQQVMLVTLHTIFLREHNRIAAQLGKINPHWDDERLFQETRHIIAAYVQQITYNEFLPMVLGKDIMEDYGLLLDRDGLSSDYNPKTNPNLPVSFFAAAFRFGHSVIPSQIEQWSVTHKHIGSRRLSELFNRPFDTYQGGVIDRYIAGFMNQVAQAVDDAVTEELTNHLFAEPLKSFGTDLAALNMQRGRDHGVPSYNAYRGFCGLRRARHWNDLAGSFTNETLQKYSKTYATPDDIDLWSAGISERPLPGSMVGPIFGCIMGETFKNLRYGDRFWYENGGLPNSFTLDQVNEIRKIKLSRLLCDNGDRIETAQVYAMVLPDPQINPRVPCKSSVLPRLNLELWRESKGKPNVKNPQFAPGPPNSFPGGFNNVPSFNDPRPFFN